MFEFIELQNLADSFMFVCLFLYASNYISLYFLQYHIRNGTKLNIHDLILDPGLIRNAGSMHNEVNALLIWLALCVRRKDSPDEEPHVRPTEPTHTQKSGGQTCQQILQNAFPLWLSRPFLLSESY
ncbi:MAG: hypothetical protein ACI4XL_07800 [Bacillus sp. (in: firmicutes)]